MWAEQISGIVKSNAPIIIENPRRVSTSGVMVREQLEMIRSLLRKEPMTTREISDELGIPNKTVQQRLSRLREGGEVKMLPRGFSDPALWSML